jgi:hypothetical protein
MTLFPRLHDATVVEMVHKHSNRRKTIGLHSMTGYGIILTGHQRLHTRQHRQVSERHVALGIQGR